MPWVPRNECCQPSNNMVELACIYMKDIGWIGVKLHTWGFCNLHRFGGQLYRGHFVILFNMKGNFIWKALSSPNAHPDKSLESRVLELSIAHSIRWFEAPCHLSKILPCCISSLSSRSQSNRKKVNYMSLLSVSLFHATCMLSLWIHGWICFFLFSLRFMIFWFCFEHLVTIEWVSPSFCASFGFCLFLVLSSFIFHFVVLVWVLIWHVDVVFLCFLNLWSDNDVGSLHLFLL